MHFVIMVSHNGRDAGYLNNGDRYRPFLSADLSNASVFWADDERAANIVARRAVLFANGVTLAMDTYSPFTVHTDRYRIMPVMPPTFSPSQGMPVSMWALAKETK